MTKGTKKMQDDLIAQGYQYYKHCDTEQEARDLAEKMREQGYQARALECSTRVKGYYEYCVFRKRTRRVYP